MTIDTRNIRTPRGVAHSRAGRSRLAAPRSGGAERRAGARQLDEVVAHRGSAGDDEQIDVTGARARGQQARVSAGVRRGRSRGIMPLIVAANNANRTPL